MIRVHIIACMLPDEQTRDLNRESGRIYTATLVHHYRIYRQAGKVWLNPMQHDRVLKAFCGPSFLHAHSYQTAQQHAYQAYRQCKKALNHPSFNVERIQGRPNMYSARVTLLF
jgi:hypothetical protein